MSDADQLQALVDGLAATLGRAVSLEDPRLVVSAGNQGRDIGLESIWPASYAKDNVLTVAALNEQLQRTDVSDFGGAVDIAAPGENSRTFFPPVSIRV